MATTLAPYKVKGLTDSERFYYKHGGYSFDPLNQTPQQGREECARRLAAAAANANAAGVSFEWTVDDSCDSSEFSDSRNPYALWGCAARNSEGVVIASLWAIDFGRGRDPWGEPYRRIVEAELSIEGGF